VGNAVSATVSVIDGGSPIVPSPPTGLAATTVSSSQISLSWNVPSDSGVSAIMGYKIERSVDDGLTWSTVQSNTMSTATTYNDTGLESNTSYTYRVSAISNAGVSAPSNTASATTLAILTITTQDVVGNPISGIWMELHSANGETIATGYTPITFDVKQGTPYTVYATNYLNYIFLHWDDGSINSHRNVTPIADTTMTATYTP
jgi:hypothetical protein